MSQKNQALLFVFLLAAGGVYFAFRMYPSTEWIPLSIMAALFFLIGLLMIFLGEDKFAYATPEAKEALQKLLAQEAEPYHEREVPIEDRDIAVLERYVLWNYAGIIFSAIAALLFFGWDEIIISSETTKFIGRMLTAFLGLGVLIPSLIMLTYLKSRNRRIRKYVHKTIIRGIVTERNVVDNRPRPGELRLPTQEGQVDYYLQLGSKRFSVDHKNFLQTTEGDAVEIHYITDAIGKPLVLHFYLLKKEIVKK
ncbi:MAG TPA: hypothetical protein PKC24_13005 [Cyclobacteriaceae bacterium]|nr:hypothetical protein [Cyclobacteriaceae bacterium]